LNSSLDEKISASEDDEEEEEKSHRKKTAKKVTPSARNAKVSPLKRVADSSPPSQKRVKTEPKSTPRERATPKASPKPRSTPKASPKPQTPTAARLRTPNAKINFSPSISLRGRPGGKTVINDDLTPQPRSKKTYEFNFELDVSMDANVIVNVKRKKKADQDKATAVDSRTPSSRSALASSSKEEASPVTRVNLRKVNGHGDSSTPGRSPRTPAVTVRKYQG